MYPSIGKGLCSPMVDDASSALGQARKVIGETWGEVQPQVCLVCGSGWGEIVKGLSPVSSIPYENIEGIKKTTVHGHSGKLWLAEPGGAKVLIFQGRRHFYEGEGWAPVIFPALLAHELGARTLLLTNAAGGIRPDLQPGDFMILSDHLNFMGNNPLIGKVPHPSITRFPDQSEIYDISLRKKIYQAGAAVGQDLAEGFYLALSGPAFETPAEIALFAKLGADAIGMSTVPEAMVANGLGLQVGAISCISNLAAGRSRTPLTHEEVAQTSQKVLPQMTQLLAHLLPTLSR
ncbi:MAG: purine-nucleoside phosphorylase [Opitutae bacterium]